MSWLFLAIAFFNALAPFTAWIPWAGDVSTTLVYPSGLATLALLLVPNGRFLAPPWRYVAWLGGALTIAQLVLTVVDPQTVMLEGLPSIPSPTGVPGFAGASTGTAGSLVYVARLAVIAAAAVSVVLRWRRSDAEERLQLRWVAYSVAFAVGLNVV